MQKIHPFYSNSVDPSDGYLNHPTNAPESITEERVCSNCGEVGIIKQIKVNGIWIEYCTHCEEETFEFINKK